jgi:cell volume regulation protein A
LTWNFALIVAKIHRGTRTIIPKGHTVIEAGDTIILAGEKHFDETGHELLEFNIQKVTNGLII